MSEPNAPTTDRLVQSTVPVDAPAWMPDDPKVRILGIDIADVTRGRAVQLVYEMIDAYAGRPRSVFFVNAHTLNLAAADAGYRQVLDAGTYVFGDGTGVRWAARMKGVRLRDNVNGTDLAPELLAAMPGRRYFLLGADHDTVRRAAARAEIQFPNWTQVGFHHGYAGEDALRDEVIPKINAAGPDLLLVGMGNPRQECWIHQYQSQLHVPVCMGVGGLFDFWAGNVSRAPSWLRWLGHEWLWRLCQQPADKARRYLLGNPLFLLRAWADRIEA